MSLLDIKDGLSILKYNPLNVHIFLEPKLQRKSLYPVLIVNLLNLCVYVLRYLFLISMNQAINLKKIVEDEHCYVILCLWFDIKST